MKKNMALWSIVLLCWSFPTHAGPATEIPAPCLKQEITFTVTYSLKTASFSEAKMKRDEWAAKIADFARQQHVSDLELQNQSYSIYEEHSVDEDGTSSKGYRLQSTNTYKMDNADAAFKFAEFLTSQKIKVNFSSNSHRQSNCP